MIESGDKFSESGDRFSIDERDWRPDRDPAAEARADELCRILAAAMREAGVEVVPAERAPDPPQT